MSKIKRNKVRDMSANFCQGCVDKRGLHIADYIITETIWNMQTGRNEVRLAVCEDYIIENKINKNSAHVHVIGRTECEC